MIICRGKVNSLYSTFASRPNLFDRQMLIIYIPVDTRLFSLIVEIFKIIRLALQENLK